MKTAHLVKIEARAGRARQLLFPDLIRREGQEQSVADPQDRLRQILLRIGGRDGTAPDTSLRQAVAEVARFFETDVPELIDAVRESQGAQRKYCLHCGERRLGLIVASHDEHHVWECRDEDGCLARSDRRKNAEPEGK